ncbi:FMN-linked oxidoreductase [Dendrothele bispora CBS 962.96]|uniref:FMN-linked oxidoreductase n=1 Tax=Dendrothele bispora (strain CBS 962.96) TaxID=1314807 RepID=A0A4S8KME8_DENBC|nr:FMN-linked oxidoreductase [Dendrothele bispora CBS 962.96]
MTSAITSKLFRPLTVGDVTLKHRVVMAPLTRFRANANHVPLPIVKEMYAQRASTPGTLLITEATFIAARASGYDHASGIWSDEQIAAWKEVTEAVHAKGSFIYLQLWAIGRIAYANSLAKEDPSYTVVSASDIPLSDRPTTDPKPRPLTIPEIKEYIALYAQAASNAVHKAGFDGVEIHGASGYLIDQFLQDVSNKRTDEYGGSVENRTRFALEVVDAVVKAVEPRKTAIRISPWNTFQGVFITSPFLSFFLSFCSFRKHSNSDFLFFLLSLSVFVDMRMTDPKPTFTHLVSEIKKSHPTPETSETSTNATRRLISAGGYTRQTAIETAEKKGDLIAFGRLFIANPDLPYRIQHDVSLTKPDRTTFYVPNSSNPNGYTDYPFTDKAH